MTSRTVWRMGPGSEAGACKRRNLCLDVGQHAQWRATTPDLASASLVSHEGGSVLLSPASSVEADVVQRNLSGHSGTSPAWQGQLEPPELHEDMKGSICLSGESTRSRDMCHGDLLADL